MGDGKTKRMRAGSTSDVCSSRNYGTKNDDQLRVIQDNFVLTLQEHPSQRYARLVRNLLTLQFILETFPMLYMDAAHLQLAG